MSHSILIAIGATALVFIAFYLWRRRPKAYDKFDTQNQAALDKYLNSNLSIEEVGLLYERQIGYVLESTGFEVEFHGALNGFSDRGCDLIARNGGEIRIIQTKCWSKKKLIGEKHIYQLYGSATHFKLSHKEKDQIFTPVFYSTTAYSKTAIEAAKQLGVEIHTVALDKSYPMVKCNVSANGEKIYHLPFDPYYDKIKIESHKGEFYAQTVADAVAKGFRRARTYREHHQAS